MLCCSEFLRPFLFNSSNFVNSLNSSLNALYKCGVSYFDVYCYTLNFREPQESREPRESQELRETHERREEKARGEEEGRADALDATARGHKRRRTSSFRLFCFSFCVLT